MASSVEGRHDAEGIISEGPGTYSRVNGIILSGQNLSAGAVLGKITASGKYTVYDNGASDGTQAAAGILLNAVDASAADVVGTVLIRGPMEFNESELVFDSGQDATAIAAAKVDLAALVPPIIVRAAL